MVTLGFLAANASKSTAAPSAAFGPVSLSIMVKNVAKPSAESSSMPVRGSVSWWMRAWPSSWPRMNWLAQMFSVSGVKFYPRDPVEFLHHKRPMMQLLFVHADAQLSLDHPHDRNRV